ncbi:MAG: hypothetical protein V2A54_14450 [Bacteroidota bacterium]
MSDYTAFLPTLIGIIIGSIIMAYMMRFFYHASKQPVPLTSDGRLILHMNKFYGKIGWVGFYTALPFLVLIFIIPFEETYQIFVGLTATLLFIFMCIVLILTARNRRVEADATGFSYTGFSGRTRTILWNEVTEVSVPSATIFLVFKSAQHTIKVHPHFVGFDDFLKLMTEKLSSELYSGTMEKLERKRKGLL